MGRRGSSSLARAVRMRWPMASSACDWPMMRFSRSSLSDEHRVDLVLDHLAHRNARPPGHHLGDRLPVHAYLHERALALDLGQLGVEPG